MLTDLKHYLMAEKIEYLLPVKIRQIQFRSCNGDIENVSGNQRPGPPSFGGRWNLRHFVENIEFLLPLSSFVKKFHSKAAKEESKWDL